MSKITDIRSRQIIGCNGEELRSIISAALGADFSLKHDGSFDLEPWSIGITATGEAFNAFFTGRRFSSLEAVAACVIDCQIEQLDMAPDGCEAASFVSAKDLPMPSNREVIAGLLRAAAKIIEAGGRNDSASWRIADACMMFAAEANLDGDQNLPGVHKPTGLGAQLFDRAAWQKAINSVKS